MFPGGRWLATSSRTPKTLATSPAEPKLCSLGSRACETLGIRDLLLHMKLTCRAVLRSDSSAALATTRHHGQRSMERIDTCNKTSAVGRRTTSLFMCKRGTSTKRGRLAYETCFSCSPGRCTSRLSATIQCGGATVATPTIHLNVMQLATKVGFTIRVARASVNGASVQSYREHGRGV